MQYELVLKTDTGAERRVRLGPREVRLGRAAPLAREGPGWILIPDPSVPRFLATVSWDEEGQSHLWEPTEEAPARRLLPGAVLVAGGTEIRYRAAEPGPGGPESSGPELPAGYRIVRSLGRSAWLALDRTGARRVVRAAPLDGRLSDLPARLNLEAKALADLAHPAVVPSVASGVHRGWRYLITDHVDGPDLRQAARRTTSLPALLNLFGRLLEGLGHVHRQGFVLRDLQPENVRVAPGGQPVVVRLGVVRRADRYDGISVPGSVLGDLRYLAPELAFDTEVGPSADLYSLGVCLYEALAGRVPFSAETPHHLLHLHLSSPPPALRSWRPDVPPALEHLVQRLLMKRPEDRPASAQEALGELRALLRAEGPGAEAPRPSWAGHPAELRRLVAAARGCLLGTGCSVALEAEPGGGRTSLLRALRLELAGSGLQTLVLRPGRDLLAGLEETSGRLGVNPMELWATLRHDGPPGAAGLLCAALDRADTPTLLLIDDLEGLDATTRAVVSALAALVPPPRAGWVVALGPAPELPGVARIRLGPIAVEDAARLLGPARDAALVQRWHREGEGHPRRIRARALAERPDPLDAQERDVLAGLSVTPVPLSCEELSRLLRLPVEALQDVLARLETSGWVERTALQAPEQYRALRAAVPPGRRQELQGRLLEVLDARSGSSPVRGLLLEQIGEAAAAAEEWARVLLEADRKGADAELVRIWSERGRACLENLPPDRATALRAVACRALRRLGREAELKEEARELLAWAGAPRAEAWRLQASLLLAAGRAPAALDLLEKALLEVGNPEEAPRETEALYGDLASVHEATGNLPEALDALDAAVSWAARTQSWESVGRLLIRRAGLLASLKQPELAAADLDRAAEVTEQTGDGHLELEILQARLDLAPSVELLRSQAERAAALGSRDRAARCFLALGREAEARDDLASSARFYEEAARWLGPDPGRDRLAALGGLACGCTGEAAAAAADEAMEVASRLHAPALAVRLGLETGRALRDVGFTTRARELLERSRQVAAAAGDRAGEGRSLVALARLQAGLGDAQEAERLASLGLQRWPGAVEEPDWAESWAGVEPPPSPPAEAPADIWEYRAQDEAGAPTSGRVRAMGAGQARRLLRLRGLRVETLVRVELPEPSSEIREARPPRPEPVPPSAEPPSERGTEVRPTLPTSQRPTEVRPVLRLPAAAPAARDPSRAATVVRPSAAAGEAATVIRPPATTGEAATVTRPAPGSSRQAETRTRPPVAPASPARGAEGVAAPRRPAGWLQAEMTRTLALHPEDGEAGLRTEPEKPPRTVRPHEAGVRFDPPDPAPAVPAAGPGPLDRLRERFGPPVSAFDLGVAFRELAVMISAGIRIDRALRLLAATAPHPRLGRALAEATKKVESGVPVSHAMGQRPDMFPAMVLDLLRVGETSGRMEQMLDVIAGYLERAGDLRMKVRSALTYPTFLFCLCLVVLFVVPPLLFENLFVFLNDLGAEVPLVTRVLMTASGVMRSPVAWVGLVAAGFGLRALWRRAMRTPENRLARDRFFLRLWLVGPCLRFTATASFALALEALQSSGESIQKALVLAGRASDNLVLERAGLRASEEVQNGRSVYGALKATGVFPPTFLHLVHTGEESGTLDQMLGQVVRSARQEVELRIDTAVAALEPAMLMVMGVVVAVMVLATVGPLLRVLETLAL